MSESESEFYFVRQYELLDLMLSKTVSKFVSGGYCTLSARTALYCIAYTTKLQIKLLNDANKHYLPGDISLTIS